jgi:hypothetical protein
MSSAFPAAIIMPTASAGVAPPVIPTVDVPGAGDDTSTRG